MLIDFLNYIKEAVLDFKKVGNKSVRIIGHLDSDGLCSTSIITKALHREKIKFVSSIVKQVTEKLIEELINEDYETIVFVDLGSGSIELINEKLINKKVFILDHHSTSKINTKVWNINPLLFDLNGEEISGAGVTYLFAKELNAQNIDLAHIALIGAIGDMQEKKGFTGMNNEIILNDAIQSGKLEVKTGLTLFGSQTRPLHKILEYSTDPYIPTVTGSEIGAIKFLESLEISFKDEKNKYRKLTNLNEDEMKRLITGIILKRLGSEEKPDQILGPVYIIKDQENESPTKDLKEFSTLLNACGRLSKYSLGIGTCLGYKKAKSNAINLLTDYKRELISGLDWFYQNRKSENIFESKKYVIINAKESIKDTMIGTVTSIITKSNIYPEGTLLISMSYTLDLNIKISVRCVGDSEKFDLKELISDIVKRLGTGIAGGHYNAAGALIPLKDENLFIKYSKEVLDKVLIEESIE